MPSDDERDSRAAKLKDRGGFLAWKRTMRLVAMDKGDIYGIFDEDGTKGVYAAIPQGAQVERRLSASGARCLCS